jgi:hypothetical protein
MKKLSEEKYGTCPNRNQIQQNSQSQSQDCQNFSKTLTLANALRLSDSDSSNSAAEDSIASVFPKSGIQENELSQLNECNKDSDCVDIRKCCPINPSCPEHGSACQKPLISNLNLPSIPFNLTIVERKKGKTVILSWDCIYNKIKPTLFVVEGRWALKSSSPLQHGKNDDNSFMTKWGYLAQTVNNNWIILRNINRGRWYKFRVASVSKSGTYGYSLPTELFILSSAPQPPSIPQNISVTQVYLSDEPRARLVNVEVSWLPSKRSDLPISEYKLTWIRKRTQFQGNKTTQANEYDSGEEEDYVFEESGGSTMIDAQAINKYTIKGLQRDSIYLFELVAVSKYDKELLMSVPQKLTVDTGRLFNSLNSENRALYLPLQFKQQQQSQQQQKSQQIRPSEDEEDEDEDDDLDSNNSFSSSGAASNVLTIRSGRPLSSIDESASAENKRPLIKNLTIQTPYFQNGLVKAKLSWQIEYSSNDQTQQANNVLSSRQEASISSKTVVDQPMFTLKWFPIKCFKVISSPSWENEAIVDSSSSTLGILPQKQLPTPITATTINTHFEIYELRYDCDYVVNVRLANIAASSSLGANSAPQIASAQFKVPSCNRIKVTSRIKPMCLYQQIQYGSENNQEATTVNSAIEDLLTTTSAASSTTVKTLSYSSSSSTAFASSLQSQQSYGLITTVRNIYLPRVHNIRHRIVDKYQKYYSVEFTWSLPSTFSRNLFSGYQINVVPKSIPGLDQYGNNNEVAEVGSVGAVVNRTQQSFVVRQLSSSINYIFQIQLIGVDNQSYGPASSLEFIINENEYGSDFDEQHQRHRANEQDSLNTRPLNNLYQQYTKTSKQIVKKISHPSFPNQINRIDYDLNENSNSDNNRLIDSSIQTASSSVAPNFYQINASISRYKFETLTNRLFTFFLLSVFYLI